MSKRAFILRNSRWLSLLVSGLLLGGVLLRLDWQTVTQGWASVSWSWWSATFALFGVSCLLSAWRWHLMLKVTQASCSFGLTCCTVFIGHFFNSVLLGPAGGDVAKSAVYARRYKKPLSAVLAASLLDRLSGGGGALLFMGVALTLAWREKRWPDFHLDFHVSAWGYLLLCLAVLGAVIWIVRRLIKRSSFFQRGFKGFIGSLQKARQAPGPFLGGVVLSFFAQLFLHSTLMVNLVSLSRDTVSWQTLMWLLPVISMISSLPISVSGAGVREATSLVFFSWYGIPSEWAVTAAMLTLMVNLGWAAVGAVLFGLKGGFGKGEGGETGSA